MQKKSIAYYRNEALLNTISMEFDVLSLIDKLKTNRYKMWSLGAREFLTYNDKAVYFKLHRKKVVGYVIITLLSENKYLISIVDYWWRTFEVRQNISLNDLPQAILNLVDTIVDKQNTMD